MRHLVIILVLTLAASLYSITANAYVIHNNTGINAIFYGEDCLPCFRGEIANLDTAACPGDKSGCGGDTTVSISITGAVIASFFGLRPNTCYIKTPVKVTAHGDVYAYKDRVEVRNDQGELLYKGPWTIGYYCDHGPPK